jgi:hypothetical protein
MSNESSEEAQKLAVYAFAQLTGTYPNKLVCTHLDKTCFYIQFKSELEETGHIFTNPSLIGAVQPVEGMANSFIVTLPETAIGCYKNITDFLVSKAVEVQHVKNRTALEEERALFALSVLLGVPRSNITHTSVTDSELHFTAQRAEKPLPMHIDLMEILPRCLVKNEPGNANRFGIQSPDGNIKGLILGAVGMSAALC